MVEVRIAVDSTRSRAYVRNISLVPHGTPSTSSDVERFGMTLESSFRQLLDSPIDQIAPAVTRRDRRAEHIFRSRRQSGLRIELKGNLAAMLSAATPPSRNRDRALRYGASAVALAEAENAKRSPETGDLSLQVEMVAGARLRLYRKLCWVAA